METDYNEHEEILDQQPTSTCLVTQSLEQPTKRGNTNDQPNYDFLSVINAFGGLSRSSSPRTPLALAPLPFLRGYTAPEPLLPLEGTRRVCKATTAALT